MNLNSFILLFFLLWGTFFASGQSTGERGGILLNTTTTTRGNTRAVVVGISVYKNLPPQRQLDYADDDAELFYHYLRQSGFASDARLILNKDATASHILLVLDEMIAASANGDQLLFYFAGHGDVAKDKTKDQEDAFLLCTNVATDADYHLSDAISLSRLQTLIASAARSGISVTLITDACRSGKVATSEEAAMSTAYLISQKWDKVMKLASCQENELSYEDVKWGNGHGVFTYYLVKGLSREADDSPRDSLVSLKELELYIKKQVSEATNDVQNPVKVGGDAKKVFSKIMAVDFPLRNDKLPPLPTIAVARSGEDIQLFDNEQLSSLYLLFRHSLRLHQTDSAFQYYLQFAAADKDGKYGPLIKNQLVLQWVGDAQQLLDTYMQGGNNMPPASAFQQAADELARAISLYNKSNIISQQWKSKQLFLQAFSYIRAVQRDKFPEAAKLLKQALRRNKKAAYIYQAFGRMYNEMEEYSLSEKYLRKAIALAPRWTYPQSDLGNTLFDMGRWDESTTVFEKALQIDSTLGRLYNNLGRNYLGQGKLALSQQYFLKADSIIPHTAIYISNLGSVLLEQGRTEEAIRHFQAAIQLDSNAYWPYKRVGEHYLYESKEVDKAEKALPYLEMAAKLEPYFSTAKIALGNYYDTYSERKENTAKAIALFKEAIALNPHAREGYYSLATIMQHRNFDTVGAVKVMERMMRYNRRSGEAYYYHGLFELNRGDKKAATLHLKKAIQLDRYYLDAYTELSLLQEKNNFMTEAEETLLQATRIFKSSPTVLYGLGNFYLRRGNWQQAVAQYQQALQVDPAYSYAWSGLAFTLLKYSLEVDNAIDAFQKAKVLNPQKHDEKEFAALVQIKADSLNLARAPIQFVIQFYEAAMQLDASRKSSILYAMAKLYFLSGNNLMAQQVADRAGTALGFNTRQAFRNLQWKIYLAQDEPDKARELINDEMEEQEFPSYIGQALYAALKNEKEAARQLMQKEKVENPANLSSTYLTDNFSPKLVTLITALLN